MLDLYVSQDQFNRTLKSTEVSKCGPGACIVIFKYSNFTTFTTLSSLNHFCPLETNGIDTIGFTSNYPKSACI